MLDNYRRLTNQKSFWAFQLALSTAMGIQAARLIHVHWGMRWFAWVFGVCTVGCLWCLWSLRRSGAKA